MGRNARKISSTNDLFRRFSCSRVLNSPFGKNFVTFEGQVYTLQFRLNLKRHHKPIDFLLKIPLLKVKRNKVGDEVGF